MLRFCTTMLIVVLFYSSAIAQTSGVSYVNSIEAKANQYESNLSKLGKYRLEFPELEQNWLKKKRQLESEIAQLEKERDAIISDMKVGARCSECKRWKTELEREGIDFEQHLGEVKGYAVPASTAELEAVRKQFIEKIALIKVQLNRIKNGDEAMITNKKKQEDLTLSINKLKEEVLALSKQYEKTVLEEGNNLFKSYSIKLCQIIANYLINNDTESIAKNKVGLIEEEFTVKKDLISNNLEVENKNKIETLNQEIQKNKTDIQNYEYSIDTITRFSKLEKVAKDNQIQNLNQLISKLKEVNAIRENKVVELKNNFQENLQKQIQEARIPFDNRIKLALQESSTAGEKKKIVKQQFDSELILCEKGKSTFAQIAEVETGRMVIAAKRMDCSVWNKVPGELNGNWNQLIPCVKNVLVNFQIGVYCSKWDLKPYFSSYLNFYTNLSSEEKKLCTTRIFD